MGGKVPVSTTVTIGGTTLGGPSTYYQTAQTAGMDLYSPSAQIGHGIPSAPSSFTATPISPQFHTPQGSQMQTSHSHVQQPQTTAYAFDPSDPALFNLDIGNFNFVNQYGALEFSMLNQITSNVNDGPDAMTPINQVPNPYNTMAFPGQQQPDGSLLFPQDHMMNPDLYSTTRQSGSVPPQVTPHNTPIIQTVDRNDISNGPYAYAIAARPNSLASASPDPVDHTGVGESASSPALFATEGYAAQRDHQPVQPLHKRSSESRRSDQAISRKRQRVSDEVYDAIKEPYSYTEGFHRLMAYLKKYYRRDNTARIAQALAAVRPALLTFAQDISERDLLQMEITVQRTLVAYDDFLRSTGTPTIAIRRDGTIMCVNEEFCLMTGWKKKVLLGRLPNRNVNRGVGGSSSLGTNTAASSGRGTRRGSAEPEFIKGTNGLPNTTASNGPIHNVLVTEIMDQDTVVQFYEDYAKLAFANPMGVGMRRGKCVKYRTPDDQMRMQNPPSPSRAGSRRNSRAAAEDVKPILEQEEGIASESALKSLGEPEGTVDVMYCWWVKRDMFEVPQLIVMNVSRLIGHVRWKLTSCTVLASTSD